MSKTKKLLAATLATVSLVAVPATLATVSLVAVPATSVALNAAPSTPLACGANTTGGCQ